MEKNLKEIIKEVGKEYEMEEEIINEIIKKLHKEFYIKLKHMKNLSIETWKSLELPINLFYVLNDLYQSALSGKQNKEPLSQPQTQPQNKNPQTSSEITNQVPQKQNIVQKQQYNIPNINNTLPILKLQKAKNNTVHNIINQVIKQTNLNNIFGNNSLQSIVHNDLSLLFAEIDNLDISRKLFKSIYTIISNIAHNPSNEKYRKFNVSKLLSTFNYKNIIPFFTHIGFKHMDNYMYLIGDAKNMSIINTELNQFIRDNKIAETTFDPYKGSISSIGGSSEQMKKVLGSEVNFEDLYYKEIERRNDIIKKAKIERKPKMFELEKNYSISKIINTINQNEEDLISDSNEDKMIIKKNLALLKEKENDRFTLKSRMRLEQLMKTPIYVKSDIRLKFPNEQILQGSFALYETIGDICNFVKDYLKEKNDNFNISTTPPLKRYLNMEATISGEKLYPNILMYVNFENEFSGLNEEKINIIKEKFEFMDLDEEETTNSGMKDDDNKEIIQNEINSGKNINDNKNLDNNA